MSAAAISELLDRIDQMSGEEFKRAFIEADNKPPPDLDSSDLRRLPFSDSKKVKRHRDQFLTGQPCHYCGATAEKIQADHVVPVAKGGSDDPSNLVAACATCNSLKRDRTPEEFRQWLLTNRLADPMDDYIKRVNRLSRLLDDDLVETLVHAAGILKQIALTAEIEFHYERQGE